MRGSPVTDKLTELVAFGHAQLLGIERMDDTHREFVALCAAAGSAQGSEFVAALRRLFEHTQAHFRDEETLMRESGFPATAEHSGEHQRVLGELHRFLMRAEAGHGQLARAWIRDAVPEWFRSHLLSMDSALAAHLKIIRGGGHVRLRV